VQQYQPQMIVRTDKCHIWIYYQHEYGWSGACGFIHMAVVYLLMNFQLKFMF